MQLLTILLNAFLLKGYHMAIQHLKCGQYKLKWVVSKTYLRFQRLKKKEKYIKYLNNFLY